MDSLEKTQTVGGWRVPVELSHTGSTGCSRFSCLFPLLPLFSFPLSEYLSNSSLYLLLGFLCLSFSLTYLCVHTYTHTRAHTGGRKEAIRSYARFWAFRDRIQVSLLTKEVSPDRERKWSVNRTLSWVPKELCMEGYRSEQGSQCSWEPGDKGQLLESVTFDLIFDRKTSVIRRKMWAPVLLRSFSTRTCFLPA